MDQHIFVDLVKSVLGGAHSSPKPETENKPGQSIMDNKSSDIKPSEAVKVIAAKISKLVNTPMNEAGVEGPPAVPEESKLLVKHLPKKSESAERYEETAVSQPTGSEENLGQDKKVKEITNNGVDILPLILKKIEAATIYPQIARRRGLEGTVIVTFRVNPDGDVGEIDIDKSSGHSILDRASIRTIKKAAPFPYVDFSLKVAVSFKLT